MVQPTAEDTWVPSQVSRDRPVLASVSICWWPVWSQSSWQWPIQGRNLREGDSCITKAYIVTDSLFQAFKAIFISPSTIDALENESHEGSSLTRRCQDERRTQTHVAKLIGMRTVEPRAIAYVACQVNQSLITDLDYDSNWLLDCLIGSFCPVLGWFMGNCRWCVQHPRVLWGDSGMVRRSEDWGGQKVSRGSFVVVEQVSPSAISHHNWC